MTAEKLAEELLLKWNEIFERERDSKNGPPFEMSWVGLAQSLLSGELGVRVIPEEQVGVDREDLGHIKHWLSIMWSDKRRTKDNGQMTDILNRLSAALKEGE